jgi:HEAT repeat protein
LARIADRSMLAAFKKDFQRERSEDQRLAHAFALTYLGDRAFIDSLALGLSSRTMGERCRAYVLELGPGFLDDLYPYLRDPDAGIRAALAGIMGELGDPAAIKHIEPLLKDPSSTVADQANRAVLRLQRLRGMTRAAEDR